MTAGVGPRRIVCLTEEPTEVLYALGEQDRIVGISGFTVRPPRARREKPKVSAFTSAKIGEILEFEPDFVVGFSDIQADIAAELIRHGIEVWISNHRSVEGIIDYVRRLGALVGAADRANAYADGLRRGLEEIAAAAELAPELAEAPGTATPAAASAAPAAEPTTEEEEISFAAVVDQMEVPDREERESEDYGEDEEEEYEIPTTVVAEMKPSAIRFAEDVLPKRPEEAEDASRKPAAKKARRASRLSEEEEDEMEDIDYSGRIH